MTSADAWQSAFTGFGAAAADFMVVDDPYAPVSTPESDDSLRERLLYVSGDSESRVRMIMSAKGAHLDTLAEEIGLRRRKLEGL